MEITIFYSWQSWTNQKVNRYFIEQALEQALVRLRKDSEFKIDCALERDTKNLPGTPAIADAILQKIDNCDLFICDLTITTESVNEKNELKASPNPNVLFELCYAVAQIGWDRIIAMMNETYGSTSKLPFDLQHRRYPITYNLPANPSKDTRDKAKKELSESIASAIKVVIRSGILKFIKALGYWLV